MTNGDSALDLKIGPKEKERQEKIEKHTNKKRQRTLLIT
jgi:hypothetical protein